MSEVVHPRDLEVPEAAAGMRLDRFLALRFADVSRSDFARSIRRGEVKDASGRALRASFTLKGGELLRLFIPGIAASTPAPPFPPILHGDRRVVVIDKPAGLVTHPGGTRWRWAVISLAKQRWPEDRVDLVHRLDKDTSGVLVLTRDLDANRQLKQDFQQGRVVKEYLALCRGHVPWEHRSLTGAIGPAQGEIRVQQAVRPDGLAARTDVTVLQRSAPPHPPLTLVRCRLFTGRTHQIRVHLAHAGHPLLGDRLYGVPPSVFLHTLAHGVDAWVREQTGADRHALHAQRIRFTHPDGEALVVEAPVPPWFLEQLGAGS